MKIYSCLVPQGDKKMYMPRLRRIDTVLKTMKQADSDTVVTRYFITALLREGKIMPLKYGDAWVVNIDELYGFLSGMKFESKPYTPPTKRTIKKSGEIWREFIAEDSETKIRRLNLRLFTKEQGIWYFISSVGHWLIDYDELMYKLNPCGVDCKVVMPRLRFHDDTVRGFKKQHPDLPVTMSIVETALQSENVFKIKNGGRWIINYDQLEREVYSMIGCEKPV